MRSPHPQPVLDPATLYFCDNGACYCGAHAGQSARYTGRDLSGQQVMAITPAVVAVGVAEYGAEAFDMLRCEQQGCTVLPPVAATADTRRSSPRQ